MEEYLSIANSPGMWFACSITIIIIFYQIIKITSISFAAGKKLGLPRKKMLIALRVGISTAILPSVAILLGLIILAPNVGIPFSFLRLSVVGSVQYELIAAGTAAKEMGLDNISNDPSGIAFSNAVWVMSLGSILHLIVVILFIPKIKLLKDKVAGGDSIWLGILTFATFFGATAYMIAQPLFKSLSSAIALSGGFFSMLSMAILIKFGKQNWLKEWAMTISIFFGMMTAGLAYHFFKIGG